MEPSEYTSGGRCEALIHWNNGGVVRCAAQCWYHDDRYCYHHQKYFDNLTTPAPRDTWSVKENGRKENDEYIEKVTSLDGKDVRRYR